MTHCWIRTSPYTLPKIFEAGRFKTQIETGSSLNAVLDSELRTAKDGGNVVYGYLCSQPTGAPTHGHDLILNEYGQAAIRLRDEIKARTTFCIADSLYQEGVELQPYSEEAVPENIDEILPYVEAQYHGGVSVEDIAEVVFQVYEDQCEPSSMIELLQEHSVPCSVHYIQDK